MKVCGYNKVNQLGEQSNNKNPNGSSIISPACDSHIDVSSLLSFSTYYDNSIWVNQNGQAYAVGSNCYGQISISIPKKTFLKDMEIEIRNKNGKPCKFLSAVCGEKYCLYQICDSKSTELSHLVYTYRYKTPLFLNISSRVPKNLYGGKETAAVIDTEGCILIITKSVLTSPKNSIEPLFLPEGDKAVKVACCDEFVLALGMSGRLFEYSLVHPGKRKFMEVNELQGQKFVDVSGSFCHCFAVSIEGRVFGRGPNDCCQLGLKKDVKNVVKFTMIHSLKRQRIISVFAGCSHSLFVTCEGKIFSCGKNYYGELLLDCGPSRDYVYPPKDTNITTFSNFCIAGCCTSVVFTDFEIPANCPNKHVSEFVNLNKTNADFDNETLTEVFIELSALDHSENVNNNEEASSSIQIENENLKKELELVKKEIDLLHQKEKENEILRQELSLAKEEIESFHLNE